MIDLIKLIYNQVKEIDVNGYYEINKELWSRSASDLSKVLVKGVITKNRDEDIVLKLVASGEMVLADSRTLNDINYPFNVKIEEIISDFSQINQNRLDITQILWENIVLEIPISITSEEDYENSKGDGWEIKEN